MQKKVLIITYYFPPSGGSGVQRWLKFVKYLPEFNIQPIVLTVDEKYASYPQYDDSLMTDVSKDLRIEKTKTCEILSLYKRLSPTKEVPYGGFSNEKKPNLFQKLSRFVRGNFFLPDPRRGWNKYAYKKACEIIEQEHIETIITTSPPHSTQLIGLRLKKRFHAIKWIADLRDPWTDIYYNKDLYQSAFARLINAKYERKVLSLADKIITVSEGCRDNFLTKANISDEIEIIPNGYDEDDFKDVNLISSKGKTVISYIGVLSPLYDTDTIVNALNLLSESSKNTLLFRFVGQVSETILNKFRETGIDIENIGLVSHKTAISYMKSSDLLLILHPPILGSKSLFPGKFFEYMASGKPILLIGYKDGYNARFIQENDLGRVFEFGDSENLSEYIMKTIANKPEINTKFTSEYSRYNLTKKMASVIMQTTNICNPK